MTDHLHFGKKYACINHQKLLLNYAIVSTDALNCKPFISILASTRNFNIFLFIYDQGFKYALHFSLFVSVMVPIHAQIIYLLSFLFSCIHAA